MAPRDHRASDKGLDMATPYIPGASDRGTADNPPDDSEIDVVEYIANMALSLREMAMAHDQEFLGYLLGMVFQEAHCESLRLKALREGGGPRNC